MQITKVNYALVVYLSLIEGLSLLILNFLIDYPVDAILGLIVGFIPAFLVIYLYKFSREQLPIKISGKEVTNIPLLYPSILNALFIEALFLIQLFLPLPSGLLGAAVLGLLSVLAASLVMIALYNELNFKLEFELNNKLVKLKSVDSMASFYAGVIEFFILPLMTLFYSLNMFSLLNGLISGFVGGLVGLFVVNKILEKKPLEISL